MVVNDWRWVPSDGCLRSNPGRMTYEYALTTVKCASNRSVCIQCLSFQNRR